MGPFRTPGRGCILLRRGKENREKGEGEGEKDQEGERERHRKIDEERCTKKERKRRWRESGMRKINR